MIRGGAVVGIVVATSALVVAQMVLMLSPWAAPAADIYGLSGFPALYAMVLASLGTAITRRHSRDPVGWIFLFGALSTALVGVAAEYGGLLVPGATLPARDWAAWLAELLLPWVILPSVSYVLLFFPNGRLPSARWRPVSWYTLAALIAWSAADTLVFATVGPGDGTPNPISLPFAVSADEKSRRSIAAILAVPAAVMCAVAFVHRFRTSWGVERQQLKWVAYAGVISLAVFVIPFSAGRKEVEIVKNLASLAVPIAVGIAILRYRLYDIDVLIKRTLVYGSLSATLGAVYAVSVILSQSVLSDLAGGSDVAVAASTLIVVALFQPLRTRIQVLVDRRFYRSRYNAARTVDVFASRLRDEVDIDTVRADLLDVVAATIQPAHASVWLRSR